MPHHVADAVRRQAAAALEALLKESPTYAHAADAWYELGHSLLEQKKEKEAIAALAAGLVRPSAGRVRRARISAPRSGRLAPRGT